MNILIPTYKSLNPFFSEIERFSEHSYTYGSLDSSIAGIDAILIHWPEQLFHFREPTSTGLQDLEKRLEDWSQAGLPIYHVVHNEQPHEGSSVQFSQLYRLVFSYSDVFVHFGNYSKQVYQQKYTQATHVVIPHPLYRNSFPKISKRAAREQLGIPEDVFVVIAPGKIRNKREANFLLSAFKSLKVKNKLLLVPRMYRIQFDYEFPGKYLLKKIFDYQGRIEYFLNRTYSSQYRFSYEFLSEQELSRYCAAADLFFIPRINTLNSGNVFLGLTFDKIVVGPAIGNIEEHLSACDFPVFKSYQKGSIRNAWLRALQLLERNLDFEKLTTLHEPKLVAQQWDSLFQLE